LRFHRKRAVTLGWAAAPQKIFSFVFEWSLPYAGENAEVLVSGIFAEQGTRHTHFFLRDTVLFLTVLPYVGGAGRGDPGIQ
jgi:hypothetical protein